LQQKIQKRIHPFELSKKAGAKTGLAGIAGGWENAEERSTILDRSFRGTIFSLEWSPPGIQFLLDFILLKKYRK